MLTNYTYFVLIYGIFQCIPRDMLRKFANIATCKYLYTSNTHLIYHVRGKSNKPVTGKRNQKQNMKNINTTGYKWRDWYRFNIK